MAKQMALVSPELIAHPVAASLIAHSVAAINDSRSPIEFLISRSGNHYMDLHSIYLCVQEKIVKKDGSKFGSEEKVTPVNYFLNSLFSQCTMFLNDKPVITEVNYPYRAILDALLFNSKKVQETFLSSTLFFKDTAGQMDSINPLNENNTNYGLVIRFNISKESRIIDLMGGLYIDLANQPKLLTNNIGFEKALQTAIIKLPFCRTDVKVFTLTSGIQSTSISNVVIGQLPYRITLGLVSNSAFNGNVKRNPFNFKNYDLNYICLSKDNQMIPSKPYTPDYTNKIYARNFISLFEDTGCIHHHKSINISYDEYRDGYTLYCFDLTPDKSGSENHVSVNELGNISVELKFSKAIPETINVICLLEYNNTLEIDHSRTVFVDY
ncbi:uncharacterized protein F54H12.2-like [Centruroides sculpturatus]|uniref:uncharacterized protein F54H12.2-like n=1 Tax=Centruroides sculpturatus TaxID=218467 RepID=UPI000C6EFCD4|nr:uncharacterized protein F54H12.2-like [Centruroides sculpturatus]